ncbi:hypothetical protein [Glutamicibacter sp. X7]
MNHSPSRRTDFPARKMPGVLAAAGILVLSACQPTATPNVVGSSDNSKTTSAPDSLDDSNQFHPNEEAVKAKALAAGRPEAAYDLDCEVWDLPEAITEEQKWANSLGMTWLDGHGAKCPDAITYPNYFVREFEPGVEGELIAVLENLPGAREAMPAASWDIMEHVGHKFPELDKITARIEGSQTTHEFRRDYWESTLSLEERNEIATTKPYPASELTGQAWADEKFDQWLTLLGAEDVSDLAATFKLITAWDSPTRGHLRVYLDPSFINTTLVDRDIEPAEQDLRGIAITILDNLLLRAPELEQVTAVIAGTERDITVSREDPYFSIDQ